MGAADRSGFFRGAFAIALGLMTLAPPRPARASDPALAAQELASSADFRVRVTAALVIGRTHRIGARGELEHALSADPHAAVRAAAAEALATLGDPEAVPALEQRLGSEPSTNVKAQIRATVAQLRQGATAPQADDDHGPTRLRADARCVIALGSMRNTTGVRGDELRRVLATAARARARVLHGVVVGSDPSLARQAVARHVPVVTLDGNITQLSESRVDGTTQVHARVEFTVRRDQSLRGTLSGGATTFGAGPTLSEDARRRLQEDAIDGAVQSALRGAEDGILVAAR